MNPSSRSWSAETLVLPDSTSDCNEDVHGLAEPGPADSTVEREGDIQAMDAYLNFTGSFRDEYPRGDYLLHEEEDQVELPDQSHWWESSREQVEDDRSSVAMEDDDRWSLDTEDLERGLPQAEGDVWELVSDNEEDLL